MHRMTRIYFAHPVTDFGGSSRQKTAIEAISAIGASVENPDQEHHARSYQAAGMDYYRDVVQSCDGLAFMRFHDGSIGAGVGREIDWAIEADLPVWEVFGSQLFEVLGRPTPILDVEQTRAVLARLRNQSSQG